MHRTVPISTQVFQHLFQYEPKAPASWQEHIKKHLVIEMRLEVQLFYGVAPDSQVAEARFPGFDYCNPYHRLRLRRHTHHRRLFRAFDELKLTYHEIYHLCDWEGTLIVRRRYEEQNRVTLRDTTGDEIVQRTEVERMQREMRQHVQRDVVSVRRQEEETTKPEEDLHAADDDAEEDDDEGLEDEDTEAAEDMFSDLEDCPHQLPPLHLHSSVRQNPISHTLHPQRLMHTGPTGSRGTIQTARAAA